MKHRFILGSFVIVQLLVIQCVSPVKTAQKQLYSGNPHQAFITLMQFVNKKPSVSRAQSVVPQLHKAYNEAIDLDKKNIDVWSKEGNLERLEQIHTALENMEQRQKLIKPFLPLTFKDGSTASFPQQDYSNALLESKNRLSEYLYQKAINVDTSSKPKIQEAHQWLSKIEKLTPHYKNTLSLLEKYHQMGIYQVAVKLTNQSGMSMPTALENHILDIKGYQLDTFWYQYDNQPSKRKNYDYSVVFVFTNMMVSPEQVEKETIVKEKQVSDGYKYLERDGKPAKDDKGEYIKIEQFRTVRTTLFISNQYKMAAALGLSQVYDEKTQRIIQEKPFNAQFEFRHQFATHSGDRSILERMYIDMLGRAFVPFPSNEQMLADCANDLKEQFKWALKYQF